MFRNLMRCLSGNAVAGRDMSLIVKGETDTGRVRDHNEDQYLALGGEQSPPGADALLVVADGMGGQAAGEVASLIAVQHIEERFRSGGLTSVDDKELEEALRELLGDVNRAVLTAGQEPDKRGMGTTCTLVIIKGQQLYFSHVGDSRAYLLRDGQLNQITTDHSWVEEAVATGTMTREEARIHPKRNIITRAIGLEADLKVETDQVSLQRGDLVLLCSDGLNSMIPDEDILKTLQESSTDTLCANLIKAANDAGGQDNTSVVIAVVGAYAGAQMPITDPATKDTVDIGLRPSLWGRARRLVFGRK